MVNNKKMLRKILFLFALMLVLTNGVFASVSLNSDKIVLGGTINITIDEPSYSSYVYIQDENLAVIQTFNFCGADICYGKKTFSYRLKSSEFPVGKYSVYVLSSENSRWIKTNFEIVEILCSDGTSLGSCSITKPQYCDSASQTLINSCSNCGCPLGKTCQTDGSCKTIPSANITQPATNTSNQSQPVATKCYDGTIGNECSPSSKSGKPYYCQKGETGFDLIPKCSICGCPENFACQSNEGCSTSLPSTTSNSKSNSLYSSKEVFLVSDKDWKNVLPFIPTAIWTEGNSIKKYPLLIYHEEDLDVYDADSIIYFIQQYSPSRVTIIGDTPKELDRLLVASANFGAGLSLDKVQRITPSDYLSYWQSFNYVVYVQDDYELSLLASTYASLINAPLIIKGTSLDAKIVFSGRKIICIGEVVPSGSSCTETYNLSSLRQKYSSSTNTDKVILVNSEDYSSFHGEYFSPRKSANKILYLYYKDSLIAPILASSKQELLISVNVPQKDPLDSEPAPADIKNVLSPFLSGKNYLTIFASSHSINDKIIPASLIPLSFFSDYKTALDAAYYADTDRDAKPNLAVGRITGISTSDVSSYIARDLFLSSSPKTNNVKLIASSFGGILQTMLDNMVYYFKNAGYNTVALTKTESEYNFDPSEWKNQDLIFYTDHGQENWAGIKYNEIPELNNSLVVTSACLTASTSNSQSFWANAIRQGALGFLGKVSETALNVDDLAFLNFVYYKGYSLGQAFNNSYNPEVFQRMSILIGDPTLNMNPSLLKHKIELQQLILCQSSGGICGLGLVNCCAGLTCSWLSCKECWEKGTKVDAFNQARCCDGWKWVTKQNPNFCCYNNPTYISKDPNFCSWCSNGASVCWPWQWRAWWDAEHCGTHDTQHYDTGCWWNEQYCGTTEVNDYKECK
jgi:hypothetical protein